MEFLRKILGWIKKHRLITLVAGVALVIALVFIRSLIRRSQGDLTEPIQRGHIVQSVYGIGTIYANHSYSIKPGIVASINELYVQEGDSVKKGAKLAKIDHTVYTAPFDGSVTFLPFKVGENVFAQLPMLILANLQDRYMVVSMEQQGALRVDVGQKVVMSFDSIREHSYDGKVEAVYSNDTNFLARINVSDLSPKILPGMTADVAIIIHEKDDALLIPVAAFEQGGVWVKRGISAPSLVPVELGIVDKDMAEVTKGDIQAGDRLVIKRKADK